MGFKPGEIAGLSAATVSSALRPQQAEAAFRGLTQEIFTPALSGNKSVLANVHKIIQAGLGDQVITQDDVMGTIKESPAEFFSLLQGGFKEYHKQGQLDSEPTLLKFFEQIGIDNTREQSALARLFTASVDLKSILESGQSAYETNIALQNEYNKAIDTFDSDVIRAGNSWSAMMDTIGTPFNERLRPVIKLFGNMFQGVRGNLKLLTDPRASQRFRNAPEDQQTIQDRLDRWNALSGRFRTVLDKFFQPFVNFTAVRNAANTAEDFGNSIAYLAERMTPFGQKIIKGFGSLTKTIADNPKLLEFGVRFTGIALAMTLVGGALLSFLALLSGPAGLLAVFGLLAAGAFALKGTFTGTSDLFKKTAEEMSTLELVLKSIMILLGLVKPEEEKPLFPETVTKQNEVDTEFDKRKSDLDESFNKYISDPNVSGPMKLGALITYTARSALLEAERGGKKQVIEQADETGMIETAPGHFVPYSVPRDTTDPVHEGMPTYNYKDDSVKEGIPVDTDAPVKLFDPGGSFTIKDAPTEPDTKSIPTDPDVPVKLFDPGGSFTIKDAPTEPDTKSIPTDPDVPVKLFDPGGSFTIKDAPTEPDTKSIPTDPDVPVKLFDPEFKIAPELQTENTSTQLPSVLNPDANFHENTPATPVIVQTGDKTANVSLTWSGDSGDLEALKAQFKQTLQDFEYDVRETEPAETT